MTRDLGTVTLYALDVVIGLLATTHGQHLPGECEVCWHVHDELAHVEQAMRHAIDTVFLPNNDREAVAA